MSIIERALGRTKAADAKDHPSELRSPAAGARPMERPRAELRGFPRDLQRINLSAKLLDSAGLSVEAKHERRQTQEFRSVKRALLATLATDSGSRHLNLIGVASALSGEGKTYVSFNLARSLASEVDRTVLLVDADLPKRDLTRALGLQANRGLLDYLRDRSLGLADVMLATSTPQLYLLPAGTAGEDSAELLAGPRMRELASQLTEAGVLAVFDSSPMLLAPDADALLAVVGSIVVVIRSMVSEKADVAQAVAKLDQSKNILGLLNAWEQTGPLRRYSAYGEYGTGHGDAAAG